MIIIIYGRIITVFTQLLDRISGAGEEIIIILYFFLNSNIRVDLARICVYMPIESANANWRR